MVGRIGFEPMTNGLRVHCSTRLSYVRFTTKGFYKLVGREGFEPSTNGLKVRCSTD